MTARKLRPLTLFLVDDHEVVRIGLRSVFNLTPGLRVVGEAANARSAVKEVLRLKPNVVLMDIRLPDQSGTEAAREILAACPDTHVLFLTSFADDDTVLAAILSGAQGYVLKDAGADALIKAIRTVASGRPLLDPRITRHTFDWLKSLAEQTTKPKASALSEQERRIVPLLAQGKTNKEIAQDLGLSDKTVKNYLSNIFAKLQVSRRSQVAALYARNAV